MNKYSNIESEQDVTISFFCLGSSDKLDESKFSLINLVRLWFSGETCRRKMNRVLTIKYGYYQGCKIKKSINELFILINFYRPLLSINCPNHPYISNDEKHITQLIFPDLTPSNDTSSISNHFVPEKEREKLIWLAKSVNISLT